MKKAVLLVLCFVLSMKAQDVHVRVLPGTENSSKPALLFPTIQYAMDHSPQPGPGGRLYVHIAPGTYSERVMVTANRPRTTFLGDPKNPSNVVITSSQNAKTAGGTFFSETVDIEAPEFEADGVTFENTAMAPGQAVAIAVRSDKAIFKHCRFLGDQDTLFADYGRQYYTESYIAGGVDFIFGNATAVFDRVDIHEKRPGYLTAQSRTGPEEKTGYVITNSVVSAENLGDKSFYLGRPWRAFSRVIVMKTSLPPELAPQGWSAWREGETPDHATYAEYANRGPGASVEQRVKWSSQLSAAEASQYEPTNFLAGFDRWKPVEASRKLP